MKTKYLMLFVAAILAVSMCLTGCGTSGEGEEADANALVYGSSDYTAINPALYEHGEINLLLFAGLTAHDADNKVIPWVAEDWKWNGDTNTYEFTLKDNVKFSDGEPLTAEDVKYTIEAIQNPDNGSENASDFEDVTSVDVIDDTHVNIVLTAPNEAMPDYLCIGILPKHILDGQDITTSEFNQNPVGAGPYKMVSWDMGQSIVMERNDDFFMGQPNIEKVVFKIVDDYDTRALQLESGELNFAQITPKAESKFESDQFKVYEMKTADYRGIMYNFANKFWQDNPELPAILSYAVDRQAIVDSVLLGHGEVAYSPLQMGDYNNENVEKYEYDPAKAEKLLKEAGWKKNSDGIYEKNGTPLEFTINCKQGEQVRIDMANICAQNFSDIGVKMNVETPAEIDWEGQQAFLIGWGSPFDPDVHTYKIFGTDQAANYGAYSNPTIDPILKDARETSDDSKRKELYSKFQEEMAKDPAYTFIAYVDAIYAGKANVKGVTEDTILGHHGVGIFWNIHEWTID
ncbi:MAG: ABC transporter substrate-binding protein [Bacillota bacterium]|nr:ABC transporter substrate-binding protein [Bacillota bacterium]